MSFAATKWDWYGAVAAEAHIDPVCIEQARGYKGIRFAIRQVGACMDENGNWEYEPTPSSRSDEWLDRFRFGTWDAAARVVIRHCPDGLGRFSPTGGPTLFPKADA